MGREKVQYRRIFSSISEGRDFMSYFIQKDGKICHNGLKKGFYVENTPFL